MSNLWDWILTSNRCPIKRRSDASQDLLPKKGWDIMEKDDRSRVAWSLVLIMAIGQTIALACNKNLTKEIGSNKFLPNIQIMIDGYTKADPPTRKMLPVEVDVPEMLIDMGYGKLGTIHLKTVGTLTLIAFYYLLA